MCVKRDLGFESLEKREQEHVSKETYVCQKRPMCVKTHIGARRVSLCVGVYWIPVHAVCLSLCVNWVRVHAVRRF